MGVVKNESNNNTINYSITEFIATFFERNNLEIISKDESVKIGLLENIKNISYLEEYLGDCSEKIRFNYSIKNDNEILYQVFEMTFNGTKIVNYSAYKIDDLDNPLDISECKNKFVIIDITQNEIMKIFENVEELKDWFKYFKEGKDFFDLNSPLYNDRCYPISENPQFDKLLQDRRDYLD